MGCVGPTNWRKDVGRARKCQVTALPPEPPTPLPGPGEISVVIGVYFSDQSGTGLSYPSRDAYLNRFLKPSRKEDVKKIEH